MICRWQVSFSVQRPTTILDMAYPPSLDSIVAIAIVVAVFVGYIVIEIVDRITASPAMRRRFNAGSDRFFRERGSIVDTAARSTSDLLSELGSPLGDFDLPPDDH